MNTFYMTKLNGFYQLRFSLNHFCISAGHSAEDRLKVAEQWLKKYKDLQGIDRVLKGLNYGCKVPTKEVAICEELISAGEIYCTEELAQLEKDCAEFNVNNTPLKRTLRVLGKTLPKKPVENSAKVIDSPTVVKRPVVFNRPLIRS